MRRQSSGERSAQLGMLAELRSDHTGSGQHRGPIEFADGRRPSANMPMLIHPSQPLSVSCPRVALETWPRSYPVKV